MPNCAGRIEIEDLLAPDVLQFNTPVRGFLFPVDEWLSGWIEQSTAQQRMQFLKVATGSRSLPAGVEINVSCTGHLPQNSLPNFHTCSRGIDFPLEGYTVPEGYVPPEGYENRREEAWFLNLWELTLNNLVGFQFR